MDTEPIRYSDPFRRDVLRLFPDDPDVLSALDRGLGRPLGKLLASANNEYNKLFGDFLEELIIHRRLVELINEE